MNNLKIFATTVEPSVYGQIQRMMTLDAFRDAKIRIMPDTHAGMGCVIGFTAALGEKVVPNLVGVDIGCFTKDTKVKLADGRDLNFEELISEYNEGKINYCYSFDNEGRIVISRIDVPRKIKTVDKIVEILLDNGEIIHCTVDHIFYDINRNEIKAENLKQGTSLYPLYIDVAKNHDGEIQAKNNNNGKIRKHLEKYTVIYQPTCHKWTYAHVLADEYNMRIFGGNSTGSYVRHHKDFNYLNNNPDNIQRMTYKEHWDLHSNMVKVTNEMGITGFKAAAKKHPHIYSEAGKKRAESTWHGKNAVSNLKNMSELTRKRNESGELNSPAQRKAARKRQLTHNTTKFDTQNKDPQFKLIQQIGKLKKILNLCGNDFSRETYEIARKKVYNGYTWEKANEISMKSKMTFEELIGYKNHKVISVRIIDESTDVYCLTNFEYGNFALSSGVFVHNCGMYVVNLGKVAINPEELDKFIRENIPSGANVNEKQGTRIEFPELEDLKMYKYLRNIKHLQSSIGSLGSGNHFLELDKSTTGDVYLVIHTGSRNLGQQVCKYYQKLAIEQCNSHKHEIKEEIKKVTEELRAAGRAKEISNAITEIKKKYENINKVPSDLCYLTGELREDYLWDMVRCQKFAMWNREEIARRILKYLKIKNPIEGWHTVHNYIDFDDGIVRKGAIRCNAGEKVIIPLNMRDGSIIGIGKGNEDWNCSGPHGAGRLMSRSVAKESISMKDFKASMNGIYTTSVNQGTLDESPMAYKNAQEIIDAVKDTVDIIEVIKPIYNFKASETEEDYKR